MADGRNKMGSAKMSNTTVTASFKATALMATNSSILTSALLEIGLHLLLIPIRNPDYP